MERKIDIDTIHVENDSAAFWKGVYLFTDEAVEAKKSKDSIQRYHPELFNVVNRRGVSIVNRVSASARSNAEDFIRYDLKHPGSN